MAAIIIIKLSQMNMAGIFMTHLKVIHLIGAAEAAPIL